MDVPGRWGLTCTFIAGAASLQSGDRAQLNSASRGHAVPPMMAEPARR